jgi:hypothetical protein
MAEASQDFTLGYDILPFKGLESNSGSFSSMGVTRANTYELLIL